MISYEGKGKSYPCERYCKRIERLLEERTIHCEGYCSFFGYDVQAETRLNNQQVSWNFLRYQTTRRGIFVPQNAHEYAQCTVTISEVHPEIDFSLKRPFFRFLGNFSTGNASKPVFRLRGKISDKLSEKIRQLLIQFDVLELKSQNGVLTCVVFDETENPIVLAERLQELILH